MAEELAPVKPGPKPKLKDKRPVTVEVNGTEFAILEDFKRLTGAPHSEAVRIAIRLFGDNLQEEVKKFLNSI